MAGAAGSVVKLAMKWGPRLIAAVGTMEALDKQFPGAKGKAAEYARQVGPKLAAAQAKKSPAGRLRSKIAVIRETIRAMEERAGEPQFAAQAAAWRKSASDLESTAALANALEGKEKRALIAEQLTKADVLLRDVIEALSATVREVQTRPPAVRTGG